MTSQRILSGSKTKGSTATLTGSVQYFYQGTSVRTFSSYVGSLLPRMGSGDRVELYKDGSPIDRLKQFDDSVIVNNKLSDMGGDNDGRRIEERVDHSYENRNFGQAPSTLLGEPYADTKDFDPVHYIQDPGDIMWPANMWNAGELDDHEFDGIIEPLDLRREIFGDLDTRYEGRAIRGSLVGAGSERPWGSKEIQDSWKTIDNQETAFLDSPLTYGEGRGPMAVQAYQNVEQSPDVPMIDNYDYHDKVYFPLFSHNNSSMRTALRRLNSASCDSITDPFEKRAHRGLAESQDVGSLAFSNSIVIGEEK